MSVTSTNKSMAMLLIQKDVKMKIKMQNNFDKRLPDVRESKSKKKREIPESFTNSPFE